ncbi:hypothetical protein [Cupriavidus oxalaticus]|uniref:hypothetical protein n=1 Tax=Cupriavidus TaxID=106589 RepID=UPI0014386786|nr:hypothetical protein [Cupriavidus oxalaticus]
MNPIIVTGTGRRGSNHWNAPRKYTMRRTNSRIEAARQRGYQTCSRVPPQADGGPIAGLAELGAIEAPIAGGVTQPENIPYSAPH